MKKLSVFLLVFVVLTVLSYAEQLKVTPEHPFYLDGKWVEASELKIGDKLKTIDGKTAVIKNIRKVEEPVTVYNLEDDYYLHNYVVGEGLVVHNSNEVINQQRWRGIGVDLDEYPEIGIIVEGERVNSRGKLDYAFGRLGANRNRPFGFQATRGYHDKVYWGEEGKTGLRGVLESLNQKHAGTNTAKSPIHVLLDNERKLNKFKDYLLNPRNHDLASTSLKEWHNMDRAFHNALELNRIGYYASCERGGPLTKSEIALLDHFKDNWLNGEVKGVDEGIIHKFSHITGPRGRAPMFCTWGTTEQTNPRLISVRFSRQ